MATPQELLDSAVKEAHKIEGHKAQFQEEAALLFVAFARKVRRVLRGYAGEQLTLAEASLLKRDVNKIVDNFSDMYKSLVSSEIYTLRDKTIEMSRKVFKSLFNKRMKKPTIPDSRLYTDFVPMDDGSAISVEQTVENYLTRVRTDMLTVANRIRSVVEPVDTVMQITNKALNRDNDFLKIAGPTIIALVYNYTRHKIAKKNKNIIKGYMWVSTIDSKTSDFCFTRNGLVWYFNNPDSSTLQKEEYPPGHPNCRSVIAYITDGDLPDVVDYPTWFNRQNEETQKEILGTRRYEMFRNGNMKIMSFYDVELGRKIPLSEL